MKTTFLMRPRKRIWFSRRSERWKMIMVVSDLANVLKRPVSSRDCVEFFREHPERRPCLLQRVGQILFKSSRPRPAPLQGIFPLGIHRNHVFYAPGKGPEWQEAFRQHVLQNRIEALVKIRLVDHAFQLLEEDPSLARNALAGFIAESQHLLNGLQNRSNLPVQLLIGGQKEAQKEAAGTFTPCEPRRLLTKTQAGAFLKSAFALRNPHGDLEHFSLFRHYASLRWPQCELFRPCAKPVYWQEQLEAFAASKWPLETEDPITAKARLVCMRYGHS